MAGDIIIDYMPVICMAVGLLIGWLARADFEHFRARWEEINHDQSQADHE